MSLVLLINALGLTEKKTSKGYADTVVFKEKSMVALGLYLAMFIAIVGSVTYYVVESPVH